MRAIVKKWGNSAAVRLPAKVLAAAAMEMDQVVEVREEDGRIIIEPVRAAPPTLDELLDQMTPDNLPEEIGFGPAVGHEAW
jgi:antitoxin MazE